MFESSPFLLVFAVQDWPDEPEDVDRFIMFHPPRTGFAVIPGLVTVHVGHEMHGNPIPSQIG